MSEDRLNEVLKLYRNVVDEKGRLDAEERARKDKARATAAEALENWKKVHAIVLGEVQALNEALSGVGFKLQAITSDAAMAGKMDGLAVRFDNSKGVVAIHSELSFSPDRKGRMVVSHGPWDHSEKSDVDDIESFDAERVRGALLSFLEANVPNL